MAFTTDEQLLADVKDAIDARINGGAVRAYRVAGRDLTYEPLSELFKLRRELEARIADTTGSRTAYATLGRAQ